MSESVAVIGAGGWGTVLANLLAHNGHAVRLWAYEPDLVAAINERHENPLYLEGMQLHPSLVASHTLRDVVQGATMICSVVPSHVSRQTFTAMSEWIPEGVPLVCASKGIETSTHKLMGDVAAEILPNARFVALSGPSFAEEVYEGQPTAIVAASRYDDAAAMAQRAFSNSRFRVYTSNDVTGVSLGGSLKNTVAIAAGILEGLHLGNNPRAALLTRGLAEIARLGEVLGARPETFAGLAGMGDLILTCTGSLSRNRQLGIALASGITLDEYQSTHRTVVEGVNTARAASQLADAHGVEMPITRQVAAVLFDGVEPRAAIQSLMERTLKAERVA